MNEIVIREDIVKGFCFYLQQTLERSVKENKIKLNQHDELYLEIRELCASGVINYKERNEIHAQLKTMFYDVFKKMGPKQNNLA